MLSRNDRWYNIMSLLFHIVLSRGAVRSASSAYAAMRKVAGSRPVLVIAWEWHINVYVYSLISHRVQQTSQFTPLVLELSLVRSHLLWGEFSAFSAAIAIHNSPLFVPPGTHHCWVDRGGMIWKACPTPLHMANSVTRAPAVTHPSTNRARRCLTSVIWRELVTTRPCATTYRPSTALEP